MSASNIKDILGSRRRMVAAAAWMLVLVAALSAATYAWFSNSRYTNVTPVAHTVSDESSDLQIGLSANGPWDTTATLAAADKTLYPISTSDLSCFGAARSKAPRVSRPTTPTAPRSWTTTPFRARCTSKVATARSMCTCIRAR